MGRRLARWCELAGARVVRQHYVMRARECEEKGKKGWGGAWGCGGACCNIVSAGEAVVVAGVEGEAAAGGGGGQRLGCGAELV